MDLFLIVYWRHSVTELSRLWLRAFKLQMGMSVIKWMWGIITDTELSIFFCWFSGHTPIVPWQCWSCKRKDVWHKMFCLNISQNFAFGGRLNLEKYKKTAEMFSFWKLAEQITIKNDQLIYLRLTLVAMAMKFETKLAITQLVWEISPRSLRLTRGFRGQAIERSQSNFTATDPGCHGNEIWAKIGYNLAYMRDISEILAF